MNNMERGYFKARRVDNLLPLRERMIILETEIVSIKKVLNLLVIVILGQTGVYLW